MIDFSKYELKNKTKVFCSACGEETSFSSILICAECLNDETNKFASLFKNQIEIDEMNNEE